MKLHRSRGSKEKNGNFWTGGRKVGGVGGAGWEGPEGGLAGFGEGRGFAAEIFLDFFDVLFLFFFFQVFRKKTKKKKKKATEK
jgi:hypothetical protein